MNLVDIGARPGGIGRQGHYGNAVVNVIALVQSWINFVILDVRSKILS